MKPSKLEVFNRICRTQYAFIHLNPKSDSVVVPKHLKHQNSLVLQVGHNMPIPIPDLVVNESGITATLSFSRSPFTCVIPWDVIYSIVGEDSRGQIWPEAMSPEMAAEIREELEELENQSKRRSYGSGKISETAAEVTSVKPTTSKKTKKTLPPYLRVIK